ncbi:hypothetical protein QFZ30_002083 [Arthrobacter pascens]|uniref:hypothetical protein n=1 Tax=Arthrobacter pascens TaxID=1677 RepID=UPI00278FCF67|nr:hypothetical protein [Arthrobacter pascens]MDQ0678701.1 hypothetical protein [Arthrobacter pascens]
MESPPGPVEIKVEEATAVERAIDDAIASVKEAADRHQTGVMLTRIAPGRYVVRARPAVPTD